MRPAAADDAEPLSPDGEGRLTSVSDRWCEVLGYPRAEVLGLMSLAFQSEAGRFRFVEEILP